MGAPLLTSLTIKNFTLVQSLDLELAPGLTTITGETGSGKSMIIDALRLALGDRGDNERIRINAERAEIYAVFALQPKSAAAQWLHDNALDSADECVLRRTLTRDGRSRGHINGHAVTMGQLRALGSMLIDIHHQHEHQSLLSKEHQLILLDDFGSHQALVKKVSTDHQSWRKALARLDEIQHEASTNQARQELLSFQIQELSELSLQAGEIEALELEQSSLANADTLLSDAHQVLTLCDNDDNSEPGVLNLLSRATHQLDSLPQEDPALSDTKSLLESAHIQVSEAFSSLQNYLGQVKIDPARLQIVEERLSTAYTLARKHKVQANDLPALHAKLNTELTQLTAAHNEPEALLKLADSLAKSYRTKANKLSVARKKTAQTLEQQINQQLNALALSNTSVKIALNPLESAGKKGLESVEFLVSTNPGQAHGALKKVASGGELSRISLAIQVVAAHNSAISTLVFDEVDVGIGGATAKTVGKLLRELGNQGQVICISHLPQVASCAHHHLWAQKCQGNKSTESTMTLLTQEQRTEEIARMLGGDIITEKTRSHAEEMLEASANP